MARTAKRPSRQKANGFDAVLYRGAGSVSAWVSQNPSLVGGATAFLIALSFVSANAIWYQPHAHTSPLFSTRSFQTFASVDNSKENSTTIRVERPAAPLPTARPEVNRTVVGDPATQRVQAVLKDLGYYKGDVDGISGPNTEAAISAYQRKMGLEVSGRVDKRLLSELGAGDITGSIDVAPDVVAKPDAVVEPEISLARIQEGLKAFGNTEIEADGMMGKKTRDGIKEFQALFGMEPTGDPNRQVYDKMVAEGLLR